MNPKITFACSLYDRMQALHTGEVKPEGVDLEFIPVEWARQIFDRMDTEVRISDQDRDNFVKNMLTVRAEKRLAFVVRRPTAMVKGNFTGL